MSPYLKTAPPLIKFICAFTLTDQSYATMSSHQDDFKTNEDAVAFYLGTAASMMIIWNSSVVAGYVLGNFAPPALALDFAVPLSFVALLIPTLKTNSHRLVAVFSSILSVLFFGLPLKTGLMCTSLVAIALAWFIVERKHKV